MKAALELVELRAGYGRLQVVQGVSLRVPPAGAVAVLGANGAGKSTLLKAILGWIPCTGGRVLLDGRPIEGEPAWRRAELGLAVIPEGARVHPRLSVMDNLRSGACFRGLPAREISARVQEIFDLFPDLAEKRRQPAGSLSGGQQQMLAIGRALVARPRLLLVDEISMGLMPILVRRVFEVLARLRQRGLSLLLVEQRVAEVMGLVDRVYLMANGRIVGEGTPGELRDHELLTRAYLG